MSEIETPASMIGHAIKPFGLTGYHCGECGRPKSQRLFAVALTGCRACDEVITRHRCTGRPGLGELGFGQSWECPDCGSTWTVTEAEDTCRECGRSGIVKDWGTVPGDRIGTAPKHEPRYSPLTAMLAEYVRFLGPLAPRLEPATACYQAKAGFMVHVRPACRCPRLRLRRCRGLRCGRRWLRRCRDLGVSRAPDVQQHQGEGVGDLAHRVGGWPVVVAAFPLLGVAARLFPQPHGRGSFRLASSAHGWRSSPASGPDRQKASDYAATATR